MSRRGQSALEFTIITGVSLLLFSVAFIVAQQNIVRAQYDLYEVQIEQLLNQLEREFEVAEQAGAGFQRNFDLPSTFGQRQYCIELKDFPSATDELILETGFDNNEYFRYLSGVDIVITNGLDRFQTGTLEVTNNGVEVEVDTSSAGACIV